MPQPKKPTKILELSGALKKNPQRKRGAEPQPAEGVGDCPKHLSDSYAVIWNEIKSNCVDGVLTIQDRHALELVVTGIHEVRHGIETEDGIKQVGGAERDRVFKQLGRFGLTPSDRSNVVVSQPEKKKGGFKSLK